MVISDKEFTGLLLNAVNQVNDTQSDMAFLSNILNAYLEGSQNATPVDIYGFTQICKNINTQMEKCESSIELIRSSISQD